MWSWPALGLSAGCTPPSGRVEGFLDLLRTETYSCADLPLPNRYLWDGMIDLLRVVV
jgi:hypothetical protein